MPIEAHSPQSTAFNKNTNPPLQKGDRGRIPSGCATMSGSFPTGPPRNADLCGKKGDFFRFFFLKPDA